MRKKVSRPKAKKPAPKRMDVSQIGAFLVAAATGTKLKYKKP